MSVRERIELNVKNMKLMWIQDFGSESSKTSKTSDKRANHALVFMFSSLADNLSQPVAVYAPKGPTNGTCIAQSIMEIIIKLESTDVKIHGVVYDDATTNRKMWADCGISGVLNATNNKVVHPLDDSRYLCFSQTLLIYLSVLEIGFCRNPFST